MTTLSWRNHGYHEFREGVCSEMAISLTKGQRVDLSKAAPGLGRVRMGLGWDAAKKKGGLFSSLIGGDPESIDLDASCIMFDKNGQAIDTVWFRQLTSRDGAIRHSGDNRTGDGSGDDETIIADLEKIPAQVTALVFTVNSFRGQTFDEVDNAFCRLVDERNGAEIASFKLADKGQHTGVIMAVVSRQNGSWAMTASGAKANGRTVQDLVSIAAQAI